VRVAPSTLAVDRSRPAAHLDDVRLTRDVTTFGRALMESPDPRAAIQVAVSFCHGCLQRPAAGWVLDPGTGVAALIAARGLELDQERALTNVVALQDASPSSIIADVVAERFVAVTGADRADQVEAGVALLAIADPSDDGRVVLDAVRSLLPPALQLTETVRLAELQRASLDTALVCIAHELRGPLLASKISIEEVLERTKQDVDLDLLRWSHAELNELASTIELLLRWTVAGRMPRRRKTDVVGLVRGAVGSVVRETGQSRVRVQGPDHLLMLCVPEAIRASVANLVRNALAYSPVGTEVGVVIENRDATACIRVTDRGRGVSTSERDSIFEPFIRGDMGHASRNGHGLGLFIAERMVRAHGGEIRVEPQCEGVAFSIEVPVT